MTYDNPSKDKIIKRLNRAAGQVKGVVRMVEEDTYCIDVLTQINAARAALDQAAVELLREHAKQCLSDNTLSRSDIDARSSELVGAISRMLSR